MSFKVVISFREANRKVIVDSMLVRQSRDPCVLVFEQSSCGGDSGGDSGGGGDSDATVWDGNCEEEASGGGSGEGALRAFPRFGGRSDAF